MLAARIATVSARIAAREGKPGYTRNVAALKAELAKLEKAQRDAAANPTAATKNPV